ncbi:MAG: hypothetical protein CMD36_03660 [Flavobacteriales bacterium]|nr:hypothetical protein [Flavobacteriales bacterium]
MKYFLKLSIFLLLTSFTIEFAQAQTKNRKLVKADIAFENEEYIKAADLYKKAYKKTKNKAIKAEIIFKQAECYRYSLNYKRAASFYKRAIRAKYPDVIVYLHYADILKIQENYETAIKYYNEYSKLNPTDVRGEIGKKSCEFAQKWLKNPTRYVVKPLSVLNSKNSDFSPSFGNSDYNEIYFTSSREGGLSEDIDERTGENYTDIYVSKLQKSGKWSAPALLPSPINSGNAHEGSSYLNSRGNRMYFTKCSAEDKKINNCSICVSSKKGKLWGDPQQLQIDIDSGITIGHPSVLESEDNFVLVFSANMSGGYGGNDLWISTKEKRNAWSTPVNLGPAVNTPGDEQFPFLHESGDLYFASNGHAGMGGLDIFVANKDENDIYSVVSNLKFPINSASDDFGIIVERSSERGYLTSNRKGGKGGDDIYQFELPKLEFDVKGTITDSKTGEILTAVSVQITSSDSLTYTVISDNTGLYRKSDIQPITTYDLFIEHEGYLNKTASFTTQDIHENKTFVIDLQLDPIKKEIILPRIEYDFAKWDLRPQSIVDLDLLVETLNDNPEIVIELTSHTDFRGGEKQNIELSQKRADVCVDYLISKGIQKERLIAVGKGESVPFVIVNKDGRFKEGDVLTKSYIKKIKFRKNKEKAHQYNRRTTFKVLPDEETSQSETSLLPSVNE